MGIGADFGGATGVTAHTATQRYGLCGCDAPRSINPNSNFSPPCKVNSKLLSPPDRVKPSPLGELIQRSPDSLTLTDSRRCIAIGNAMGIDRGEEEAKKRKER